MNWILIVWLYSMAGSGNILVLETDTENTCKIVAQQVLESTGNTDKGRFLCVPSTHGSKGPSV